MYINAAKLQGPSGRLSFKIQKHVVFLRELEESEKEFVPK